MQSVLSRIWTRVAVSISNDDNHYTTGTSFEVDLVEERSVNLYIESVMVDKMAIGECSKNRKM